jgi:hypothetical protein
LTNAAETSPRRSWVKRALLGCGLLAFLGILIAVVLGYYLFSPNSSLNRKSTIQTVMEWGRLADFPVPPKKLSIQATGSMFTRGFRVRFQAPAAEVEKWLKASPGIGDSALERPTSTTRKYSIRPGGGAQHAEVIVDDQTHTVMIYVYWS